MNLDNKPTYQQLGDLTHEGHLSAATFKRALILTGHIPNQSSWQKFINYLLLVLGAGFTVSGIFFFFAYNWDNLSHFAKFGLIEIAMIAAIALAQWFGLEQLPGKIALLVAAMLVGALFALFGQIYQTGADAYTLFLNWAILIIGWVIIGDLPLLWLGLLGLVNLTWGFYWSQVLGEQAWPPTLFSTTLILLNGLALAVWEIAQYLGWQSGRWANRLIATVTLFIATITMMYFIFEHYAYTHDRFINYAPFIYMGFITLILLSYSLAVRDLFMLTAAAFSVIVVNTAAVGDRLDIDCLTSLVISFVIIVQAAAAVTILRKIQLHWEVQTA